MPKGGIRKTTWPKGKKPPVKKPIGVKHKRTVLKEAIGLQNWDGLKEFIEKNGATKLIKEMSRLRGKAYVQAYSSLVEFVKPKLSRVDAEVSANIVQLPQMTREEIKRIAQVLEEEC